jgi:flagellar FliJ protein
MARRFQFNLEAVLRYRNIMADERRREFLEAKKLVDEEKVRREEMARERGQVQDEIVRGFEDRAPMSAITAAYHMVGRLESAMQESLRRQKQLEAEVERRRQAMIHANQEKQVMESLKERRREEFVREEDRVEQAFLDELSIQSRGRRRREAAAEAELEALRKADAARWAGEAGAEE